MAKKKILQIITLAECGGAQTHLLEIVNGLKENFDFCVIVGEAGFLTDNLEEVKQEYKILPELVREISPAKDFQSLIKLIKLIKEIQPDLIHCHSSKAGVIGRLAAFICNKPSIFTAHGWAFHPEVKSAQRIIALISEITMSWLTQRLICVSDFDKKLAQSVKLIPYSKLQVIHNGISQLVSLENEEQDLIPGNLFLQTRSKLNILMVGRFAEPKRQDLLIQTFAKLNLEIRNKVDLLFAGNGPLLSESEQLAEQLGLKNQIHFLGEIRNISDLLNSVDVLVLLSDREGLPISILEAMRAGLPVVASDVGGISELIQDQKNGFLIQHNQFDLIINCLQTLINSESLREQMGMTNRKIFEEKFTSEKMLRTLAQVYGDCITYPSQK
ncbi:MAG: glycosyltransferase family 4 protein [Candidatus Melainabacteria bacterium]